MLPRHKRALVFIALTAIIALSITAIALLVELVLLRLPVYDACTFVSVVTGNTTCEQPDCTSIRPTSSDSSSGTPHNPRNCPIRTFSCPKRTPCIVHEATQLTNCNLDVSFEIDDNLVACSLVFNTTNHTPTAVVAVDISSNRKARSWTILGLVVFSAVSIVFLFVCSLAMLYKPRLFVSEPHHHA